MTDDTPSLSHEQRRWVERAVPSVNALARSLAPRIPHASVDELESAGYEGLVEAALRYDPSSGVPFGAFAHYRVRGAMIDAARRHTPALRRRARALRMLQASQALLEQAQKSALPPGVSDPRTLQQRVAAAAEMVAQQTTAVLLSKRAPRDPDTIIDAAQGNAEQRLLSRELRDKLDAVLAACSDEERHLIDALYREGKSMHEYAESIDKSVSTVSRHHSRIIGRLSRMLGARLGDPAKPPDS